MIFVVTGATGDIGSSFVRYARKNNHSVKVLIRADFDDDALRDEGLVSCKYNDEHVFNSKLITELTTSDATVHFASILDKEKGTVSLERYIAVNALLTGLLAVQSSVNKSKFVHISSVMVYNIKHTDQLENLRKQFVSFCNDNFTIIKANYDLKQLAHEFIDANNGFPFNSYNFYTLSKYLAESISLCYKSSAVLRISNAYGPNYQNPRLIPRLIVARLSGQDIQFTQEKRDFVYCDDIDRLIGSVCESNLSGIIDCKSGEIIDTKEQLRDVIVRMTPTSYGDLKAVLPKTNKGQAHSTIYPSLQDVIGKPTSFSEGLANTLMHHKEKCYHEMNNAHKVADFIKEGEKIEKQLAGSSAAYTFLVSNTSNDHYVRKIAIREGVEGNGVAKLKSETKYYEHIEKNAQELAKLYPRLIDKDSGESFMCETIEYIDGPNFYAKLMEKSLTDEEYRSSFKKFIQQVCKSSFSKPTIITEREKKLRAYYIERSLARIQPIYDHVPQEHRVCINGKLYKNPQLILKAILDNKKLIDMFAPRIEYPCFHGDLTLLNTVYQNATGVIKLIDPRGHVGMWDPLYDFGKLKFTLSGFGELIIGDRPLHTSRDGGFTLHLDRIATPSQRLNESLFDVLSEDDCFRTKIIEYEPYWQERIFFAEATHYLADIPFRLFIDKTNQSAIASYVIGTLYLNELVRRLEA